MNESYDHFWSTTDLERRDARSRQRAEAVLKILPGNLPKEILDVGCGRGIVGEYFIQKGFSVWGVDFSQVALQEAVKRGIQPISANVENLNLDRKFPIILCLEVLEHLACPLQALQRIMEHLEDPGILVVSLPNEFHLLRRLLMVVGHFPFSGYNYPHLHLFSLSSCKIFFREAGLEITGFQPLSLLPPRSPQFLRKIGDLLSFFFPSLFSLSLVFSTRKKKQSP